MKHQAEVGPVHRPSRHDGRARRTRAFPRIDCAFQPRRFGNSFDGSDSPRRRPGFTLLTREVLLTDASRSVRLETAVLGFVSLICAWPIVIMIHEVIRFLR